MARSDQSGQSSIDRLTLLFKTPHLSLWTGLNNYSCQALARYIETKFPDMICYSSSTELFAYHYRLESGYDIQFGPRFPKTTKFPTDLELSLAFGSSDRGFIVPQTYGLRIEFNPNKVTESFSVLSPLFNDLGFSSSQSASDVRISRIDVAIDYPFQINPALTSCSRSKKSFTAIGPTGLESLYYGSRSSASYFRIYNKALEIFEQTGELLDHPLWRVELESKQPFSLVENPDLYKIFQRLTFYYGGKSTGDWQTDLILQQASEFGLKAVLNLMPYNTRDRWKEKLKQFELSTIEHPADIYFRDFPPKWFKLRSYILLGLGFDLVTASDPLLKSSIREY